MKGYDQWKTASPYDDWDDTICYRCMTKLDENDKSPWADEGFCSKECMDNPVQPTFVRPMDKLLASICGDEVLDIEKLRKAIYKGTSCGANLFVEDIDTIVVTSIVEGSDAEVMGENLKWPFTLKEFWEQVEYVNNEACSLWDECHCPECGGELEDDGFTICPECEPKGDHSE